MKRAMLKMEPASAGSVSVAVSGEFRAPLFQGVVRAESMGPMLDAISALVRTEIQDARNEALLDVLAAAERSGGWRFSQGERVLVQFCGLPAAEVRGQQHVELDYVGKFFGHSCVLMFKVVSVRDFQCPTFKVGQWVALDDYCNDVPTAKDPAPLGFYSSDLRGARMDEPEQEVGECASAPELHGWVRVVSGGEVSPL